MRWEISMGGAFGPVLGEWIEKSYPARVSTLRNSVEVLWTDWVLINNGCDRRRRIRRVRRDHRDRRRNHRRDLREEPVGVLRSQ